MSFRCPGYLNAKSLSEDGDCRKDYGEWFSNSALAPYRSLIDAVYGSMQYRGDDPVLLVCDVSSESCLLFRFTMKLQDRNGRNHQRCEVMKVERSELSALLNGEFKAVPDEYAKEFVVESVERTALPQCERHSVKNEILCVYTQNPKAYWFKSEASVPPPRHPSTSDSKRYIRPDRTVDCPKSDRPKKGEKIMFKVLFTLLIVLCVLGGWNYFQSTGEIEQLRNSLKARDNEVVNHRAEIEHLRRENDSLQAKISRFEEWTKTRSNFELNKIQLKIKSDEIIKNFKDMEKLLAHMDEPPKPASKNGGVGVTSGAVEVNAGTNNVPVRAGTPQLQSDNGKNAGTTTGSSRQKRPRVEIKNDKKKEKGLFDNLW